MKLYPWLSSSASQRRSFVLGSQLFTKIWVRAMIGLLKKVIDRLANQVERKFETQFR